MEPIDGSIRSIRLQNFFCLSNLFVEFKTNVTFLIGGNGSGKSAILTALVVGLGGRACTTNRGKSVVAFIKKGTNSATIEIKIKNSGPITYNYNEYGDYITVVKTISLSGTTNYKTKSVSGDVISRSAKEVNAIVFALDIQVDNLISILNQDDARAFHKQEPEKIYTLYRRATKMDQTEENYNTARANCNKALEIWKRKKEYCDEINKECHKWKKIQDQMQSREESRAVLKKLKNELIWSEIVEFEREITIIQNECDKQRAKCAKLEEKVKSMDQISESGAIEALKKHLEENKAKKMSLEQELRELESVLRRMRDEWSGKHAAARTKAGQLKREENNVLEYERELRNTDSGLERAQLERRVGEAHAAVEETRVRYATQQNDMAQARANAAAAADRALLALDERRRRQDRRHQLQQQMRELEARGADSLALYGSKMVTLCQRVRSAAERNEFSEPPRGPIGHYLKLREKEWGGTLEHIIGNSIRTFCVSTLADSRKLFQIMEEVYRNEPKPSVTCSQFLRRAHDVSRTSVSAGAHRSALHALHVDDPVVVNFLIDNLALEKVLLVPDHDEAMRLSSTLGNVPRNCLKIVTLDCTEYHPAPRYRSYGGARRAARHLHVSNAERKQQLQVEIQEVEETLQNCEAQLRKANVEAQSAKALEQSASRDLEKLFKLLRQKETEEREAIAALDQLQAPQLAALEEGLNVSKLQIKALSEVLSKFSSEEENFKRTISERERELQQLKTSLAEVIATCRQINEEINQEEMKLEGQSLEKRTWQKKLEENSSKLAEASDILLNKQANVEAKKKAALAAGPRVDHPREKAVVLNLLTQTQKKMNVTPQTTLSREHVEQELRKCTEASQTTRASLEGQSAIIDKITRMTDKHLEYCYKRQKKIDHDVECHFLTTLSGRRLNGEMSVDHGHHKLTLLAGAEGRRPTRTVASLSGGQRSYCTVAFIAAIWEVVELPFYFLDEFDVFLDGVNRQMVVEFLLSMAARLEGRQFVFLTPNRVNIHSSELVSIQMLPPPERIVNQ